MTAQEIMENLGVITIAIWEAAKKAADETAAEIYIESTEVHCPVDTQQLKDSAKNEVLVDTFIDIGPEDYIREISYDTPYAHYQHEMPFSHSNPPTATWKYLSIPLYNHQESYKAKVMEAVSLVL